jgi:hypothetical protein
MPNLVHERTDQLVEIGLGPKNRKQLHVESDYAYTMKEKIPQNF